MNKMRRNERFLIGAQLPILTRSIEMQRVSDIRILCYGSSIPLSSKSGQTSQVSLPSWDNSPFYISISLHFEIPTCPEVSGNSPPSPLEGPELGMLTSRSWIHQVLQSGSMEFVSDYCTSIDWNYEANFFYLPAGAGKTILT